MQSESARSAEVSFANPELDIAVTARSTPIGVFGSGTIPSRAFTTCGDAIRVPPNTPVVPEPTSLALADFAGIEMAADAWRRRRPAKSEAA